MISEISKDSQDSNSKSTKLVAVRNLGILQTSGLTPGWDHWIYPAEGVLEQDWEDSLTPPQSRVTSRAGCQVHQQWPPTPSACSDLTPSTPVPSLSLKRCKPWVSLSLPWSPGEEKSNIYLPPDFVLFKCQQGRGGPHSYFSSTSEGPAESLPRHLFIWGGGGVWVRMPP